MWAVSPFIGVFSGNFPTLVFWTNQWKHLMALVNKKHRKQITPKITCNNVVNQKKSQGVFVWTFPLVFTYNFGQESTFFRLWTLFLPMEYVNRSKKLSKYNHPSLSCYWTELLYQNDAKNVTWFEALLVGNTIFLLHVNLTSSCPIIISMAAERLYHYYQQHPRTRAHAPFTA